MKNELLEQLKEIIEPKLKEDLIEVVTKEELYDKIFEEIVYYANSLESEKETISITIEESNDNERICEISFELDKENSKIKNRCSYITASGLAINTIESLSEMFVDNNDTIFFKEHDFSDSKIKLIIDYPSIAAGLKVEEVCKKIYEKQKEVSE